MDEMKLESKFTTNLISKLLSGIIRKKLGYDVNLKLNRANANIGNEKIFVHVDADVELTKKELTKILKSIDL